jgi:hypothetical protein
MSCSRFHIIIIFLATAFETVAQMPETDIWLFQLDVNKNHQIKKGLNISARKGYDNQPSFSGDGKKLYYTSVQEASQSDVFMYVLKSKKLKRLTSTTESEYSPTEHLDGKSMCTVTVLKDSSQVLQQLSQKSFSVSNAAIAGIDSVGYFTFLNNDTLIYYVLTNPHSLRVITVNGEHEHFLAHHPTRGFKAVSRHEILYGVKDSARTVYYLFDFRTKEAVKFAVHEGVHEDLFWHPEKGLLISDGQKIKLFRANTNVWETLYDLSSHGVKKITRFCFSLNGKYLAVVDNTD